MMKSHGTGVNGPMTAIPWRVISTMKWFFPFLIMSKDRPKAKSSMTSKLKYLDHAVMLIGFPADFEILSLSSYEYIPPGPRNREAL